MPLSPEDLAYVRSWVGDATATSDLDARYDRLGSVDDVIEEVLKARLATLTVDTPTRLQTPEGVMEDWSGNLKGLERRLAEFQQRRGDDGAAEMSPGIARLHRPDTR